MPEGVEVKISAELIEPLIKNKKVIKVSTTGNSRSAYQEPEGLLKFNDALREQEATTVIEIKTKGKLMYWNFANAYTMFCTFGMTGQWSPKKGNHPCLIVEYLDDSQKNYLYFNDPRHFGTIDFSNDQKYISSRLSKLGWDPLLHELNFDWINWIYSQLKKCGNKPIAQVLLDQAIFAGVGNYIRAEALYQARISPWRSCQNFSRQDTQILCKAIVEVMKESYAHQGATIHTYKDAYGQEGKYSSCFKVYGRQKDPLGNSVKSESTPEGRTIHWCPNVQT